MAIIAEADYPHCESMTSGFCKTIFTHHLTPKNHPGPQPPPARPAVGLLRGGEFVYFKYLEI